MNTRKKTLIIICAAAVIVLVPLGAFAYRKALVAWERHAAQGYIDGAVPAVAAAWDESRFAAEASPELLALMGKNQVGSAALFNLFSTKLGAIESYARLPMKSFGEVATDHGVRLVARFEGPETFLKGTGAVKAAAISVNGFSWRLLSFTIDSDALTK